MKGDIEMSNDKANKEFMHIKEQTLREWLNQRVDEEDLKNEVFYDNKDDWIKAALMGVHEKKSNIFQRFWEIIKFWK